MNRQEILNKIKAEKDKEILVITDGSKFIESLESKTKVLAETLNKGLDINSLDELLDDLQNVGSLKKDIITLNDSIKALNIPEIPDSVKIDGLDSLLKALKLLANKKEIKIEPIDLKPVTLISEQVMKLTEKIENLKLKPSQKPTDFIPMRRVVYVSGKTPMFDDSFYTGGGGGSNTPLKNGSVPVVNPDGSLVGGSGGGASTIADGADIALGSTTDSAIDTDTTGTVSGKLRGIIKLVVNLLSRWPASLGQKTKTNSLPIVIASDQDALPVTGTFFQSTQPVSGTVTASPTGIYITKETRSSSPAQSSVADTASSTTLVASNANRLGATIFNDSTVALYLKLGATASTTSFTIKLDPQDYYEIPFGYTGIVDGIWASDASGSARITELT